MSNEIEFVDGLIVKAPHERAPDFVKAQISIKVADLGVWLLAKHTAGEEWVNLDIKEAKSGKWYAAVSKKREQGSGDSRPEKKPETKKPAGQFDDDIPF